MSQQSYRCLSIQQPWARAVVTGLKDIENRTWDTEYRGPVVIQASSTKRVVNRLAKLEGGAGASQSLAYGALIGIADLVEVEPLSESLESNPWASGPCCWRFANARVFKTPIAAKGKLNLYALEPNLSAQLDAAVGQALTATADNVFVHWMSAVHATDAVDRRDILFDSYCALEDGANLLRLAQTATDQKGDGAAYADRAIAKYFLEQGAAALSDANRAIELDSENARGYAIRSLIHAVAGDTAQAERDRRMAETLGGTLNRPTVDSSGGE